jgi:hypothetical protein
MNLVLDLETKFKRNSIRIFVTKKILKSLKGENVMGFGPNGRPFLPKCDQPT